MGNEGGDGWVGNGGGDGWATEIGMGERVEVS